MEEMSRNAVKVKRKSYLGMAIVQILQKEIISYANSHIKYLSGPQSGKPHTKIISFLVNINLYARKCD